MKSIAHMLSAAICLSLGLSVANAGSVIYDFTGNTYVGGHLRSFTGVFEYDDSVAANTVYFNGQPIPQDGFRSTYGNSVRRLSIYLDDHESVICSAGGSIDVNNMQQVGAGSQVPAGLTVQAWAGDATGTINGQSIWYMYLAFLPVDPNFSWQGLNGYFGGDAQSMLQADPSLLPGTIDPSLTGTMLNASIHNVSSSLFLGTIHTNSQGTTTTVNSITSFELRVPAPGIASALAMSGVLALRRRR